jgi:hypothetical protein
VQSKTEELFALGRTIATKALPRTFLQREARARLQTGKGILSMMEVSPAVNSSLRTLKMPHSHSRSACQRRLRNATHSAL